jgi:hypothetical protein
MHDAGCTCEVGQCQAPENGLGLGRGGGGGEHAPLGKLLLPNQVDLNSPSQAVVVKLRHTVIKKKCAVCMMPITHERRGQHESPRSQEKEKFSAQNDQHWQEKKDEKEKDRMHSLGLECLNGIDMPADIIHDGLKIV